MKAVVLAAGRGTRLRPLTDETPKARVDIDGRSLPTDRPGELVSLDGWRVSYPEDEKTDERRLAEESPTATVTVGSEQRTTPSSESQ